MTNEWTPIIRHAAKIIGSSYRNSGVVAAALSWMEQELNDAKSLRVRLDRMEAKKKKGVPHAPT